MGEKVIKTIKERSYSTISVEFSRQFDNSTVTKDQGKRITYVNLTLKIT